MADDFKINIFDPISLFKQASGAGSKVGSALARYLSTNPGPATEEELAAAALPSLRMSSSGRRPERLNASREVNAPLQVARGWTAALAGLPGDLEGLGRHFVPNVSNTPALPTSEFYREWLPGRDETPAGRAFAALPAFAPALGAPAVARGLERAARSAPSALAQLAEAAGSTVGRKGAAGQRGAVRTRGGNFDPIGLEAYLDELTGRGWAPEPNEYNPAGGGAGAGDRTTEQWARKQLANYLKKDLGSPTDPLLQVEKELPNLHLPEDRLGADSLAWQEAERVNRMAGISPHLYPAGSKSRIYAKQAQRHYGLTDQPLTPWGQLSDSGTAVYSSPYSYAENIPGLDEFHQLMRGGPDDATRWTMVGRDTPAVQAQIAEAVENGVPKWLLDAPADTKIYGLNSPMEDDLGFRHVLDYLDAAQEAHKSASIRNWAQEAETLPHYLQQRALFDAGLALDPQSLGRLSVADAVRKTARWNELMAANAEAAPDLARGIKAVHKEYPDEGMRWVELGAPEHSPDVLPEGWSSTTDQHNRVFYKGPDGNETFEHPALQDLRAGLNAEGVAMGHCVGGYCNEVAERGTKIYSLRDAKGNPHVTVEVTPGPKAYRDWETPIGDDEIRAIQRYLAPEDVERFNANFGPGRVGTPSLQRSWASDQFPEAVKEALKGQKEPFDRQPDNIVQIKGKQNAAPVAKYLPFVQDFVKSGQWGRVGDLRNTGLRPLGGRYFTDAELQAAMDKAGGFGHKAHELETDYFTNKLMDPRRLDDGDRAFLKALGFDVPAPSQNRASGGSVQPHFTSAFQNPGVEPKFAAAFAALGRE